jgi:hypothetical protein
VKGDPAPFRGRNVRLRDGALDDRLYIERASAYTQACLPDASVAETRV